MKTRLLGFLGLCLFFSIPARADYKDYTDVYGRTHTIELVSVRADTVKFRMKSDPSTVRDAKISIFDKDSQGKIQKWAKENPPKIDYAFEISADKKKLEGDNVNLDYKRVKIGNWAYEVKVGSRTREVVSGLELQYRAFMTNQADGEFGAMLSEAGVYYVEDKMDVPDLKYNENLEFKTKPLRIEEVKYGYFTTGNRYKDRLAGLMIRFVDKRSGEVVYEYATEDKELKNRTWKDPRARKDSELRDQN